MRKENLLMNKVLITGGAGFIGSNIAISLYDKGYEVTVLDNLSEQIHGNNATVPENIKDKVKFVNGNVINKSDWLKAIEDQDAIIHLAAETGTGQSMYEIERYSKVNIMGTSIMLDILTNEKHKIKKVIVASSRAVYGEGKYKCGIHGEVYPLSREDRYMKRGDFELKCPKCSGELELMPTDEDSKINAGSVYGITKYNQEQMVLTVGKSLNIPSIAFRYQNVYGPGQSLSNPYTGILSIFSTRIKNGNDINIFEDGKESRDFVYIDDVVNATILGLEKNAGDYEVFNVGSGAPIDVLTVANTLRQAYNSDVKVSVSGNYRLGDIRHNYADITKLKMLLGYEPIVMFDEGISKFVKWVNTQVIKEDSYERSINEMKEKGLFK
jgi:dTDP-L-rhamnose 4-epimerase